MIGKTNSSNSGMATKGEVLFKTSIDETTGEYNEITMPLADGKTYNLLVEMPYGGQVILDNGETEVEVLKENFEGKEESGMKIALMHKTNVYRIKAHTSNIKIQVITGKTQGTNENIYTYAWAFLMS